VNDEMITWYASRRVDVPLRDAADALDQLVARGAPERGGCSRLPGALAVRPIATLPGVGRRLRGSLALGGIGGPVPVELELLAWSRDCAEVALRPAGRPPVIRTERYFSAATGAVCELAEALHATVDERQAVPVRRAS
jgi:hypothetical protein